MQGVIHVGIDIGPVPLRGSLVGSEGVTVTGPGGVELVVPAGALTTTISASIESVDPTLVGIGFEGLALLGGVDVDLSDASLSIPATVSLDIGALASTDYLFAAKFLFVSGLRKLTLIGPAGFDGSRISTGGVDTDGTLSFLSVRRAARFGQRHHHRGRVTGQPRGGRGLDDTVYGCDVGGWGVLSRG